MACEDAYLLPKTVVPVHYDLQLLIDLENLKFSGTECVILKVVTPVKEIQLHAVALTVGDVTLCYDGGKKCILACNVSMDKQAQTLVITLAEEVPAGDAELHLSFSAPLDTQMRGLYRSKYSGPDGSERWMAVTQFEAASARRCFPCWDEPELKATFSITLTAAKDRVALSNMPEESCHDHLCDNSLRVVKFCKSPIMSTYLVALVVGEYEHLEKTLDSGVLVRVFTPKGRSAHADFALDVATRALPYYTEYFQIPYPLPKLDLISIPDFSAGAMENWGLVTFRETLLLVDPLQSSAQHKQRVALVVAHELAHQWFGNLVTMKWWTHLWLNEGYANFSQTLCGDFLFPEYKVWTQFQSSSFIPALELDSLHNTHPVEVVVGSPDTVDEIFDEISYDKGASVICMLHRYLGEEDFRKGMALYLKRHQYSNTATEDLWKALSETSGKPVEKVMSAWTKQSGFPMVSVSSEDKDESTVLKFSQTRFVSNGTSDQTGNLWCVPIDVLCSEDGKVYSLLLVEEQGELVLPKLSERGWVKVNAGACGFYRTKYSSDLLQRLIPMIASRNLSVLDRINVLNDLYAMVKAGHSRTDHLLKVLEAYKGEDNYSVCLPLRSCMISLNSVLSHRPDTRNLMQPLIIDIFKPVYSKLGWEPSDDESYLDRLLRPLILSALGESREPSVVEKCRALLASHAAGVVVIPADLRACVFRTCMLTGDESTLETLMKLYQSAEDQEERDRVSQCMGSTSDLILLQRFVDFTMQQIRAQDIPFVLYVASLSSAEGSRFVWQYFKTNYQKFVSLYSNSDLMIRLVKMVSSNFASEADAADIENYFGQLVNPTGLRVIQQNLESIRLKAALLERDCDVIKAYFSKWQ